MAEERELSSGGAENPPGAPAYVGANAVLLQEITAKGTLVPDYNDEDDPLYRSAWEAVHKELNDDLPPPQNAPWEKTFPFGPAACPREESLRGYKCAVQGEGDAPGLPFSPQTYSIFDEIIARESGKDSVAFNANLPGYKSYAPLRRNLAILRNYLLVRMFPDAEYKPHDISREGAQDRRNYLKIKQMALRLGKNLAAQASFREAANMADRGVEVMYDFLFGLQSRPSLIDRIPFLHMAGEWGLAPLADTPFSRQQMLVFGNAGRLQGIAAEFDSIVLDLRSVESLSRETKKISIRYAEEILEKLKLLFGSGNESSYITLRSESPEDEGWMLLLAARAYKDAVAEIARLDVSLLRNNATLQETFNVLEQLSYRVKADAAAALGKEGRKDAAKAMEARMAKMPESARTALPVGALTQKLRNGLREASRLRQVALTTGAQVHAMADHVKHAAHHTGVSETDIKAATRNMGATTLTSGARVTAAAKQVADYIRLKQQQMADELHRLEELRKNQKLPSGPGGAKRR